MLHFTAFQIWMHSLWYEGFLAKLQPWHYGSILSSEMEGKGGYIDLGIESSCDNTGFAMAMHAPLDHNLRIWFHSFGNHLNIIQPWHSTQFYSYLFWTQFEWLWWIILDDESSTLRIVFRVKVSWHGKYSGMFCCLKIVTCST